jgi:hypothetical protein
MVWSGPRALNSALAVFCFIAGQTKIGRCCHHLLYIPVLI